MNLLHKMIKIKYIREGYLKNYPPNMISDSEMCDAFLNDSESGCFFKDYYPLLSDELSVEYDNLLTAIKYHINSLKHSKSDNAKLPDWVYSYMLGSVISVNSDKLDIHDLLVSMNVDNIDDIFTEDASKICYELSRTWLKKYPLKTYPEDTSLLEPGQSMINLRPPTMFGEPHVIKSLRLQSI